MSSSQKRISCALIAGAALIAVALFIRSYTTENTQSSANVVVVTTAPERTAIKTIDENNDGVPDWQEALVVTEALQIASTTSDYKEPETLTEQFALDFFQDVVRAKNYEAFGDTPEELVLSANDELAKKATDELLTKEDISTTADNSAQSLTSYGEEIALIALRYPDQSEENEAVILETALRDQNPNELDKLDPKIENYENLLTDTLALSVPTSVQKEHLDLVNTYRALLSDITAMRTAFADPMLALLRMKRYQDDTLGLYAALGNLYNALYSKDAEWQEGSPVFSIISIDPSN